ncbi:MAG: hypothetical protein ATN36_00955 [Epulopiscium sp. Nele67-Bin005]|nr:MAG: hypothetical protein ATN36_00955 [Epulopiscium sp. Nele67-Bin005]
MSKISVIIPIYNVEMYLEQCLISVVNQTLKDIEIICIDDASTDLSSDILNRFAQSDSRIKLISYQQNKSASQARKDGVSVARGKYIIFMDADDYWEEDLCEDLYLIMEQKDVDILHFNAIIENHNNLPEARIRANQKSIAPYIGKLQGREVFSGCFINHRYFFTLWNKIFKASLCKKAFYFIQDGDFPKAQDLYAYFLLAYFANSYEGISGKYYYHYYFGRGITGHNTFSLDMLERFCKQSWVIKALTDFLNNQEALEVNQNLIEDLESKLMSECINNWKNRLPLNISGKGFDILMKYWDPLKVVTFLAHNYWNSKNDIAGKIRESQTISKLKIKSTNKVIATYYYHLSNGGVQKVVSKLIPIWIDLGYKVILFIDTEPNVSEYDLPQGVERVILPPAKEATKENYAIRAKILQQKLLQYEVNIFIYHAWQSQILLWDLMVCKINNVKIVVNTHSVFSIEAIYSLYKFFDYINLFSMVDALVCLSKVDRTFWSKFIKNVIYMPNPMPYDIDSVNPIYQKSGKNIIWIGRISSEKNPLDVIQIMSKVVEKEPSAKLFIIGSSINSKDLLRCEEEVANLNIKENVIFCGFHKDVTDFYNIAKINLIVSAVEGFSMVLAESKIYGVPTVMYELPYLELVRTTGGILSVPQSDQQAMANEIINLLNDEEKRVSLSHEARKGILQFNNVNLNAEWENLFSTLLEEHSILIEKSNEWIMLETMFTHINAGLAKKLKITQSNSASAGDLIKSLKLQCEEQDSIKVNEIKDVLIKLSSTTEELNAIKSGWSFRIGRIITLLPRKLKGGIYCYKEHGVRYTITRINHHVAVLFHKIKDNKKWIIGLGVGTVMSIAIIKKIFNFLRTNSN